MAGKGYVEWGDGAREGGTWCRGVRGKGASISRRSMGKGAAVQGGEHGRKDSRGAWGKGHME